MKCARLNPIVERIHPSLQKNSKGETVAFCCNGCKNKFAAAQPVMSNNMITGNMGMQSSSTSESTKKEKAYRLEMLIPFEQLKLVTQHPEGM